MADTENTTPAQSTEPEWQQKADEMKQKIDGKLWVQLAYRSDATHNCEPILLSDKQTQDVYPIVVEAPTGMINPKKDWHTGLWEETDTKAMGNELADLKSQVKSITDNSKQNDTKLDQMIKMITMTNLSVGKLGTIINQMNKPQQQNGGTK